MRYSEHPRYRKRGLKRLLAGMLCLILVLTSSAVTVFAEETEGMTDVEAVAEEQEVLEEAGEAELLAVTPEETEAQDASEEPVESEEELEDRLCGENESVLKWCYDPDNHGECHVEHCNIYLLDEEGNNLEIEDEVNQEENLARYILEVGETYRLRIVPDGGYRIRDLRYDDYTLIPTEDYGVYSFTMGHNRFRIWDPVERINNEEEMIPLENNSSALLEFRVTENSSENLLMLSDHAADAGFGGVAGFVAEDADFPTEVQGTDGLLDEVDSIAAVGVDAHYVLYNGGWVDDRLEYWTSEDAVDPDLLDDGDYTLTFRLNDEAFEGEEVQVVRTFDGVSECIDDDDVEIADSLTDNMLELRFTTTNPLGIYTFFRTPKGTEGEGGVHFHLNERLNRNGEFEEITLEPVANASGLVFWGEDDFTYSGAGDIKLQLKKDNVPLKTTYRIENGIFTALKCRFFVDVPGADAEQQEQAWNEGGYDVDVKADGTVTLPACIPYGGPDGTPVYPVRYLLEDAGEKDVYIGLFWDYNNFRPARQVVIEKNYWGEEAALVAFDEEYVVDKRADDDAMFGPSDGCVYIRPDAEKIRFQLEPYAPDGLTSVAVKTVNFDYDMEDGDEPGEMYPVSFEKEPNGQYGATTVLAPILDGGELWYEMDVPQPREWDWDSNLGIKIIPNVEERTRVSVKVKDLSFGDNAKACAELFDVVMRVGSQMYPVELDDKETLDVTDDEYYAYVPVGATVTVSVASIDGMWTVSKAVVTDTGKNSGKDQKASKNGEYTVQVPGFDVINTEAWAEKDPSLELQVSGVAKLLVTDADDYELFPENKKYNLGSDETFNATVQFGSMWEYKNEIDDYVAVPLPVENTKFKNGSTLIEQCTTLTTTGATLNAKSLSLKAVTTLPGQTKETTLSASFAFSTKITGAGVSIKPVKTAKWGEFVDEWLVAPYGTKQTFTLTYSPAGANTKNLRAEIWHYVEMPTEENPYYGELQFYKPISAFGSFNGKTVVIDPAIAKKDPEYYPNSYLDLVIMDGSNPEPVKSWSLGFEAPDLASTDGTSLTPTVKANDALSTTQEIGLSLTLPKKMKAMNGLYYKIVAETDYGEHIPGTTWTEAVPGYSDDPEDPNYKVRQCDIVSYWDDRYDDEGHYDEVNSRKINVYKKKIVAYVPSTEKTWAMNVTDEPQTVEDGWQIFYKVTASMVYAVPDDEVEGGYDVFSEGDRFDPEEWLMVPTKDRFFETKLSLTKKAPAKIYTGQMNVPIAIPKWSKTTTVKGLDRIELINEYGNCKGSWSRWDERDGRELDLIDVNPETGLITLDTIRPEKDEDDQDDIWYLEPGKYDIVAYAIAGPGKEATATMSITVLESIRDLAVTAPARVLKSYGKAATVKADVAYNLNDWYGEPSVKKVEWSIKQPDTFRADGSPKTYKDIPEDSPLYGMVTIKNGTATIDKNLLVDLAADADAYSFVIAATAADYEGSTVVGYSEPVVISSQEQIPTQIRFAWERWENDVFKGYNFSDLTEEEISNRNAQVKDDWFEPFYSNQIQNSKVLVYDQYGHGMAADLKLSGIKMDANRGLILEKPGKVSITATAQDGSKKSKKIEFTIAFSDKFYVPNVLIQQPKRYDPYNDDDTIINCNDRWNESGRTGEQEGEEIVNDLPANKPILVHVAGIRNYYFDVWDDDEGTLQYEFKPYDHPDFGNNALINHKLSVSGGKIKKTYTGYLENYTTYEILPEKRDMVITLTDNTVDNAYERQKTDKTYYVTNIAIPKDDNAKKAPTISASKKEIYKWMNFEKDLFIDEDENLQIEKVPNYVEYTVSPVPERDEGTRLVAKLSMDELKTDGQYSISRYLGLSDDNGWMSQLTQAEGVCIPVNNGKFAICYFEENMDNRDGRDVAVFDSYEIPAGTYEFYVTLGQANTDDGEGFEALAKPVKVTVKVANAPAPKLTAVKSYKLTAQNNVALTLPTTTNIQFVEPYHELRSSNTNGETNRFNDLFWVNPETQELAASSDEDGRGYIPEMWIPVGSGKNVKYVIVNNWYQIKQLKDGKLKTSEGDDGVHHYDSEHGELIADANTQNKAYKNFVKTHCTGFIGYDVICLDGRYTRFFAPVTVDIDAFIDTQTVDPDAPAP